MPRKSFSEILELEFPFKLNSHYHHHYGLYKRWRLEGDGINELLSILFPQELLESLKKLKTYLRTTTSYTTYPLSFGIYQEKIPLAEKNMKDDWYVYNIRTDYFESALGIKHFPETGSSFGEIPLDNKEEVEKKFRDLMGDTTNKEVSEELTNVLMLFNKYVKEDNYVRFFQYCPKFMDLVEHPSVRESLQRKVRPFHPEYQFKTPVLDKLRTVSTLSE